MDLDDALDHLGAVRRSLSTQERQGKPARALTAERTYPAPAEDVWDAVTDPVRLPRWFLPVEGDLLEGGRYQLIGNAGGLIERCDPPRSLSVTWEMGEAVSWVELSLTERDGSTTLVLTHVALVDEFAATYGPGAVGVGWDLSLMGLAKHLEDPSVAVDHAAAEAWSVGDEGRAFMTRSSDAWCEADVAGGTDPADARARADRTTAFYLGEAAPEDGHAGGHA